MGEIILGLHPQPEEPREFILRKGSTELVITTDQFWEYEGDAMTESCQQIPPSEGEQ